MMTFKELKAKLLTCEKTLKCLQNGTYKDLSPSDIQAKQTQLNTIKEGILKQLKVLKEAVEFEDEGDAAEFAEKNPETPVKVVKEAFSIVETKAIAKKVGEAVIKAYMQLGEQLNSTKVVRIDEGSFDIRVLFRNGKKDELAFHIYQDGLYLDEFEKQTELVNVGVKPSGDPIVHVDVLANAIVNHFKKYDRTADDEVNEGEGDDHHYVKVPRMEFKAAERLLAKNIDGNHIKMDVTDDDGMGNVIIYFMFKDDAIATGEADSFMYDAVMDLQAHGVDVQDHSAELDETKGAPKGHYFTKSGNLVKGTLSKDARERGARLSDPKDKQRSKVPPVTQYNEMDANDPVLMRLRANALKKKKNSERHNFDPRGIDQEEAMDLRMRLKDLEEEREDILRNMEQEAEPEGGPIADDYGSILNDIDEKIYKVKKQIHQYDTNEAELGKGEKKKLKDMSKSLKKSSKGHAGQAKYIDKLVKEGRGDMDMIKGIIRDRAAESGFEEREEAAEVIAGIADEYMLSLKVIQAYLDSDGPVNPSDINESTDLYDRNGIQITRFAGGKERGLMVQINYGGKYIHVPAGEFANLARAMQSVQGDLKDPKRQYPRSKNMEETTTQHPSKGHRGGAKKIQKAYDLVIAKMKELAKQYKAGDKSVVPQLKDLTFKKNALEVSLEKAISQTNTNQTLAESPEQEEAVRELRDIVDNIDQQAEEARDIVRQNFPNELSRLDGYGVFNVMYSANRYNVTLGKFVDNLEDGEYDEIDDDNYPNEGDGMSTKIKPSKGDPTNMAYTDPAEGKYKSDAQRKAIYANKADKK